MSRNNDCTTGNFLDFAGFKENYRLTAIDLNKQTKLKDPQKIDFIGKLENQAHGALKTQNVWQKSGTLLTVKQRVTIHTKI